MDKITFHVFCAVRSFLLTAVAAFLIINICAANAYAVWSTDPTINNPISTAANDEWLPTIVSDGNGGAIITWINGIHAFAQRIDANGNVLWTPNGVSINTVGSHQYSPTIVTDGSGGAIISWIDYRTGYPYYDIYAQRVDANGNVLWTPGGVPISVAGNQGDAGLTTWYPSVAGIVTDNSGGAIITWGDSRIGYPQLYAQRIDANGNVLWTPDGVPITTVVVGIQGYPSIVTDNGGGAIITWMDSRSGNYDIYSQRIDANGNVLWTQDGVAISTAANSQLYPTIVSDGSGGAIITWKDGTFYYDVYAQRIDANGNVLWTQDGVAISTAANTQERPTIVSDGSGGAIITWQVSRSGYSDIYAQRINANGNVLWTTDGVAISMAANNQYYPFMVSDGSSGAIITWYDYRSGNGDIYSQRVNGSGTFTSTLSVSVNGNGSVVSSPAGISCPGDCSETYALGTSVTLTAAPGSGWAFIGWEGACTGTGACTFNMTVDTSVTAIFKQTWFEESDLAITYTGTWSTSACSSCSGGAMKSTSQTGAKANFSFSGTGVRWIASKTSKSGKANVYIDGVLAGTVDLYSKTSKYQVVVFERTGLSPGNHTLTIENPGKRVSINIDAFEVIP